MHGFRRWSGLALAALLAPAAEAAIVIDLSWVDQDSAEFQRFKAYVDRAVAGHPDYGFSAADAAYLYRLTGQAQYATLAVQLVEAQVAAAESDIAGGGVPDIAGDQYLEVGPMIEDLALAYDWCSDHVSPTQRTRWSAYAEQAVWNVWHHTQAQWGGHPHPWPGWGVDDPANNYHYSFLRATMYWGLASDSATWLALLADEKWPGQLAYTATIPGGGSQEGTAYGLSHGTLFQLYRVWRDSTAADIGNANAHLRDSIQWWIHATVPTRDRVAAIGDQARVSEPVIYDYHRHLMLEALDVASDATARANASWWLHSISDQAMESSFNYRHNLMPAGPAGTPPSALVHHATGTGQLFARTGWHAGAMWLNFSAGPYVQSHAHQDQGAFTLFEGDWLAVTENIWTHSGIQQGTDTNNVLRFVRAGSIVPQREGTTSTMAVTPGGGGSVHAVADLTPAYDGNSAVTSWQRTIDFAGRTLTVSDAFTLGSGTEAVFQVNTPVQPQIAGTTATAGRLKIRVLSPPGATLSALDWTTRSGGGETYHRGWRLDIAGGSSAYVVEFSTGDVIFADGYEGVAPATGSSAGACGTPGTSGKVARRAGLQPAGAGCSAVTDRPDPTTNPCVRCGACCATYRVSFYWSEAEAHGLPSSLVEPLDPWMSCMAGTNSRTPRCAALHGAIGGDVGCAVYARRPSPCRALQPGDDQCNRARLRHGLPSLRDDEAVERTAA